MEVSIIQPVTIVVSGALALISNIIGKNVPNKVRCEAGFPLRYKPAENDGVSHNNQRPCHYVAKLPKLWFNEHKYCLS